MRLFMLVPLLALAAPLTLATPAAADQAKTAWVNVVQKTPEGGYRQGNPAAPIRLVEYGSRSCPTCRRFALEGVAPLRANYIAKGKVSYEYRDFPIHPQDIANVLLGRCVGLSAYFPVLDRMYAEQDVLNAHADTITEAEFQRMSALPVHEGAVAWAQKMGYIDFMAKRGVSAARSLQCLRDSAALAALGKQLEAARGVNSTPTFFVNGRKLENIYGWSNVEAELKAAGA